MPVYQRNTLIIKINARNVSSILITRSITECSRSRARADLKHCAMLDGKVVGGMKECLELRLSGPEEVAEDVELQTFIIAGVPELGDEGLV